MDEERKKILVHFAIDSYSSKELIEMGNLWDELNEEFKALPDDEKEDYER